MGIHKDPAIFEDPFSFRPERWFGEQANKLGRFYAPFLKGPRSCLGQK
jgi:cytochrome P450